MIHLPQLWDARAACRASDGFAGYIGWISHVQGNVWECVPRKHKRKGEGVGGKHRGGASHIAHSISFDLGCGGLMVLGKNGAARRVTLTVGIPERIAIAVGYGLRVRPRPAAPRSAVLWTGTINLYTSVFTAARRCHRHTASRLRTSFARSSFNVQYSIRKSDHRCAHTHTDLSVHEHVSIKYHLNLYLNL